MTQLNGSTSDETEKHRGRRGQLGVVDVFRHRGPAAAAQVSAEEARAIGVDAYLYFYPLVTMDLTRRQLTNVEPGKGGLGGPPNTFVNIPEYPSADMKVVVRPTSTRSIPARGSTSPRSP